MQYVRSMSGAVSKTWASINPATLSGAIDVIVVEQADGSFACSPFHVRFGKYQILRPSDKKVEFAVNGTKQDYPMKLGDGGEAFFVFETTETIPEDWQTSPLISPETSPQPGSTEQPALELQEPEPLDLSMASAAVTQAAMADAAMQERPSPTRTQSMDGETAPRIIATTEQDEPLSPDDLSREPTLQLQRSVTDEALSPSAKTSLANVFEQDLRSRSEPPETNAPEADTTEGSPEALQGPKSEAVTRAINLSKKLWSSNIPTTVTDAGDLMLDMTGYKSSDEQALRAEVIARKLLSEEIEGDYDIGALIGIDENGNVWIYSSEDAKEAAHRKAVRESKLRGLQPAAMRSADAISDPGYHTDDAAQSDDEAPKVVKHIRHDSDSAVGMSSTPQSPEAIASGPVTSFAKTIRLTSEQLKGLKLHHGVNAMSFTVNRGTLNGYIYLWKHDVPIVVSDIDGTITKSDVLGHVMNSIGRDWTHLGVAKLYTDIVANGYNILYLTSRSNGQADTTRTYLSGVVQEGHRLPKGPVIMSPDRTIAALRREVYLRKPEVFKMSALRDIMNLYNKAASESPFYAGFGNRFTDALSYRSVNIPQTRIFTINSNAEVSLDLLSLNTYKTGYVSMRELLDHFFPPVSMLLTDGGEEFTDFNYWRERPLDIDEWSASEESESDVGDGIEEGDDDIDETLRSEDEYGSVVDDLEASYISRDSIDSRAVLARTISAASAAADAYEGDGLGDDYGYGDAFTPMDSVGSSVILEEQGGMYVAEPDDDEGEVPEGVAAAALSLRDSSQDQTPKPTLRDGRDIEEEMGQLENLKGSPGKARRRSSRGVA